MPLLIFTYSMMGLLICKFEPFWQKVCVESLILKWPLRASCLIERHCFLASNGCLVSWYQYVLHNLVDFNTSFHFRMGFSRFIITGNETTILPEVTSTTLQMVITTVGTTFWSNSAVIAGVSCGAFLVFLVILVAVWFLICRKVCMYC